MWKTETGNRWIFCGRLKKSVVDFTIQDCANTQRNPLNSWPNTSKNYWRFRVFILLFENAHFFDYKAGSSAVAERLQFESRMRRLKLACSRWKMAYQREMHKKYQDLSAAMEERYMRYLAAFLASWLRCYLIVPLCSEVSTLLQEISECKAVLADANRSIDIHEKEMVKMQDAVVYFKRNIH